MPKVDLQYDNKQSIVFPLVVVVVVYFIFHFSFPRVDEVVSSRKRQPYLISCFSHELLCSWSPYGGNS